MTDEQNPIDMAAVEAILFAAGYPVKYEKIAQALTPPDGAAPSLRGLKERINEFAAEYNSPESGRGLQLLIFEDSCQICTRREYAEQIRTALGIRRGGNLSAASLEVLAVIAYNQPVTRAFIDSVRGSDSAYSVSTLLERGLIEVCGRLDVPGRPMLFGTTEGFLRCFGISSLDKLPEVHEQLTIDN